MGRGRSSSRNAAPRTRTPSVLGHRASPSSMTPWAGQTVRIVFAAADRGAVPAPSRPRSTTCGSGVPDRQPDYGSWVPAPTRGLGPRCRRHVRRRADGRSPVPAPSRVTRRLDEPVEHVRSIAGSPAPVSRTSSRIQLPGSTHRRASPAARRGVAERVRDEVASTSRMRTGSSSTMGRSPSIEAPTHPGGRRGGLEGAGDLGDEQVGVVGRGGASACRLRRGRAFAGRR